VRNKTGVVFFVVAALSLAGCATGKPLLIADLDEIGWDRAASFQCYLSSNLTLTKLPGDSDAGPVNFGREGAAHIRESRWTIVLPASLEGRILNYHKRDQFLYVAFEEGEAALPFALDKNGRFSLMSTIDQGGVEFVEYEGARYQPDYTGAAPHLNVVINRSQEDLRRQMQGSRTAAALETEDAVQRAAEKLIGGLPENVVLAVLNISADEKNTAVSVISIMEELEFRLLEPGRFKIVDRRSLDAVRAEQDFQISGAVSDESAVSIGNMLGANIVITGALSGSAGARRLSLKALDVQSAELIAVVREQF
jgi:hypothetical protein